jgi:hypothetical protein
LLWYTVAGDTNFEAAPPRILMMLIDFSFTPPHVKLEISDAKNIQYADRIITSGTKVDVLIGGVPPISCLHPSL